MLTNILKIVVVVGCQRSGTTIIGQILGAHPDALLIDETDNVYEWFSAHISGDPCAEVLLRQTLTQANTKYRPQHTRLQPTADGALRIASNITHLILKVPDLTYSFGSLSRLNTPVSVVYPVRDPRSVVTSILKLKHTPLIENQLALIKRNSELASELSDEIVRIEDDAAAPHIKATLVWQIKSSLHQHFIDCGLPTFRFRYEDLVDNPADMCRRVANHVGLSFDTAMMAHEKVFCGFASGMIERSRPIDALSISRWANWLTAEQERQILDVARDAMQKLGYRSDGSTKQQIRHRVIPDENLRSPIILVGRGGSGTRIISEIAAQCSVFLGNRLNANSDSVEWIDVIYEMGIHIASNDQKTANQTDDIWDPLLLEKAKDVLSVGNWREGTLWGWKLPETMMVVPQLFSPFPDAKLVHLVRHPIDSSLRRTHMTSRMSNPIGNAVLKAAYRAAGLDPCQANDDEEYMHNAITWLYQVNSVMDFGRSKLPADQYLEIRYEDLCTNPSAVQDKFINFIGGESEFHPLPQIDHTRMRGYEVPDPRVEAVWELCKDTAIKLGYGPIS